MNTKAPALELADLLNAVAEHLTTHPHLPAVNVDRSGLLQISAYPHRGETNSTEAVLLWARTMDNPTILIRPHGDLSDRKATVNVSARINGVEVTVWDVDEGDLTRWHSGDRYTYTEIPLDRLAAYVAAGTVDGVIS